MQFGIFTVGDVTTDPTTGRTPTEHERIKATVAIAKKAEEVGVAGGEDVEPDLLGLLGDGDHRLDALVLARRAPLDRVRRHVADGEDPELHACHGAQLPFKDC